MIDADWRVFAMAGFTLALIMVTGVAWLDFYLIDNKMNFKGLYVKNKFRAYVYVCAWEFMFFAVGFWLGWMV